MGWAHSANCSGCAAVIGSNIEPTSMNFNVETWSVYWRKSPLKNEIVELDGQQTQRLAKA
jgi:hypothetical protein